MWHSASVKNPNSSPLHSEHHLPPVPWWVRGSWAELSSFVGAVFPRLLCPPIQYVELGVGASWEQRFWLCWPQGGDSTRAVLLFQHDNKHNSLVIFRERDLSGRAGVRQGQLCTSADTTVCPPMKTSMTVPQLTCLPPFGKHLSFLLLSGLVGGAGLRCRGSGRGGIAAPLTLPDLPVIQKHPHSLFRVSLT